MNFQKQLEADVESVFLNPDEFGEEFMLNGVSVFGVRGTSTDYPMGEIDGTLPVRVLELHVRTVDLPGQVRLGREVEFEGARWAVQGYAPSLGGLVRLTLSRRGW